MAKVDWLSQECLLVIGGKLLEGGSSTDVTKALNEAFSLTNEGGDLITRSATCSALNRVSTWNALAQHFTDSQIELMHRFRKANRARGGIPPHRSHKSGIVFGDNPRPFGAITPPGPADLPQEDPGTKTIMTLGERSCKWPIGNPLEEGFTFCGRTVQKPPYCKVHERAASRKPKESVKKPKLLIDDLPIFYRYN